MKTYIVQLEDHDDVISARDKISWSKARRILLVWPRRGRVLERRVDLQLLLRCTQSLGGQLALVTQSSAVKEQAAELGIPVFSDALEAQEASWRRLRKRSKLSLRNARLKKRKFSDPQMVRVERLAALRDRRAGLAARMAENLWVRLGAFTLGIAAFLMLALAFVPGAEVVVKPERIPQQLEMAVWASPEITTPNVSGGLPVETMRVVVEGRDQVESSGQQSIPDTYATGLAVLTNLTDQVVEVPQGSILLTTSTPLVRFITTETVKVPAGPGKDNWVSIRAEAPGSAGNLPAGKIQAMEGAVGLRLRVSNSVATSGGEDRSSRAPTAADYQALRAKLMDNLRANALEEARSQIKPGQRLLEGALNLRGVLEEKREPAEGQPADRLQLSMQVEFAAWTVREADLQAVAQAALDANRDKLYQPVPGSLNIVFTSDPAFTAESADTAGAQVQAVAGAGAARWTMRVERTLEKSWTQEGVIRSIQGKELAEAKQILEAELGLREAPQMNIFPGWWGYLPFLPARIEVINQ